MHPPKVFYPLGPEISEHWFRDYDRADPAEIVCKETVGVHWYASVRTAGIVPAIDPAQVVKTRGRNLISELLLEHLEVRGTAATAT